MSKIDVWWLSFAGDEGSRGIALVINRYPAQGLAGAIRTAHELSCNPGGEVLGYAWAPAECVPSEYLNKLLTRAQAMAAEELTVDAARKSGAVEVLLNPLRNEFEEV